MAMTAVVSLAPRILIVRFKKSVVAASVVMTMTTVVNLAPRNLIVQLRLFL